MEVISAIFAIATFVITIILLILVMKNKNSDTQDTVEKLSAQLEQMRRDIQQGDRDSRKEIGETVQNSVKSLGEMMIATQKSAADSQQVQQQTLQTTVSDMMGKLDKRIGDFSVQSEQKLDNIRTTMQRSLSSIQEDNNAKLEQMRITVDEKLQKTLDEKLNQSFANVSERLEQVHKGLGEMQNLASGVGDLKKVLSNVKTRGVLGEIQLGAILEQILAPEQYEENVATKKGAQSFVEYAVLLPADDGKSIYLPIDAKFPADCYSNLIDAYEDGDTATIEMRKKELESRIKQFAKDISTKYIDPPNTTDFAIMFLPFEGLYSEVVRMGLVETLQNDYKISIAGPTTMAALLNSLQMGFKTLAIQKRSSEVWEVLGAVKTEFDKFGDVIAATQQRIDQANKELDKLVGVRTRQIQRRLKSVSSLPDEKSKEIIELTGLVEE